jgi:hypothetical protein
VPLGPTVATEEAATYDNQASLGAGAWGATSGLDLLVRASDALTLVVGASVLVPLERTDDDRRWGADTALSALSRIELPAGGALSLLGGVEGRVHGRDQIPDPDLDALVPERQRVGGRRELGALVGVQLRVGSNGACFIQSRVPLWREVGGVQLVESVSVTVGGSVRIGS